MEDIFMYSQAVWILLSGISIILALFLMVFLTTNCLRCFRKQAARDTDTELLLDKQIQEVEYNSSLTVSDDHSSTTSIPCRPGKPVATSVTHDSVKLEWTKPEQGAHNIKSYTILHCSESDPSNQWIQHKVQSTTESLIVSELSEYTFYRFKVRADCETGIGVESDVSDAIQTHMIIPGKPGKPKASIVSHDSIQLEWAKPEQGDHNLTSYTVLYCCMSSNTRLWKEHKAVSTEKVIVPQLSEKEIYYFKIRSECAKFNGAGLESDISEPVTTKMIVQGKPGKPRASEVNHDSIELEWTKPEQGAHNITTYVIFYRSTSDCPNKWTQLKTQNAETKVTVSNLLEKTIYRFKVQPKYEGGVGIESEESEPIKAKVTFREAYHLLWKAREKWYEIGLCLRVDDDLLNVIQKSRSFDIDFCYKEMLRWWYDNSSGDWQMLIDALHHETVSHQSLANETESDYQANAPTHGTMSQSGGGFECPHCHTCSLEQYLKRECPEFPSSPDSAFPYLDTSKLTPDEKLSLYVKLTEDAEKINKQFKGLVDELIELFKQMPNEKCEEVVNFMKDWLLIPIPSFEVKSPFAVIQHLKDNISFFNYYNLQMVIAQFGTDKDNEKLRHYEEDFKRFCERSVFEVPEGAFGSQPDRGKMLIFKVTDEIIENLSQKSYKKNQGSFLLHHAIRKSGKTLKISLNQALRVHRDIAKILGIENIGSMIFLGASIGCIQLKCSVPVDVLDKIKKQGTVADLEAADIHMLCGPPGKPYAINVTSNSIHLKWSKPEYEGYHPIQYYYVHYMSLKDRSAKWRMLQSNTIVDNLEIKRLSQNETPFIFKVQAVDLVGAGVPSKISDPIDVLRPTTDVIASDLPSKPGQPQPLSITHDSIQLEWTKPEQGVEGSY